MINALSDIQPASPILLTIHVISASFLPKPGGAQKGEVIDPFVHIFVNGPNAADNMEKKTKCVSDNGFNPVFNQIFSFDITQPDLSYLTFQVYDDDLIGCNFVCFSSLPVVCLRTGLRTLPLYSATGSKDHDFEFAQLFVRCTVEADDAIDKPSVKMTSSNEMSSRKN